MTRQVKNVSASIRQKLLSYAHEHKTGFQQILQRFCAERLLYRLGVSDEASSFVLKGASLFLVWTGDFYRPTKDVDFLAHGSSRLADVSEAFQKICEVPFEPDGVEFLKETVEAEEIREEQEYEGVRVTLDARLGTARVKLQADVGFGDCVVPKSEKTEFPTILDLEAPNLEVYSRESTVAEKYEAMVRYGIDNSRMKDFYDIWVMAREFSFDGCTLADAIRGTFERRKTEVPQTVPVALTSEFVESTLKQTQWKAFLNRGEFKVLERDLGKVVEAIASFLTPPTEALAAGLAFGESWEPRGPWS